MNLLWTIGFAITILIFTLTFSCNSNSNQLVEEIPLEDISFFYGADLSYVNEMEDCSAVYKNSSGEEEDVYKVFNDQGANLVRLRLWHSPEWTNYSTYNDVKAAIERAKQQGLKVLLDFHYSDTWADPSKQEIPAAWLPEINNTENLGSLLYDYTYNTLDSLAAENILPDIVQVGNEINGMILQQGELVWPIDWSRNSYLLNKGIEAVRNISEDRNTPIEVMLHIAQPENGLWWFEQATANGVTDFDWIGLSYYPTWSEYDLNQVETPLRTLINTYSKRLMIVETAYPFTLEDADSAGNIMGESALTGGIPATEQGQLDYLNQLYSIIKSAGGEGLVYWEPAWVSTNCSTLWAQGSHWDNATLFKNDGLPTKGMQFYNNALND
ncbi:glycosyl hydrolase 53 family protein [Winogradskyella sp. DF17]|uniref:Arabinogalactan endo-beta-1,4-galactanase n=1 Tax=Winogradskyella pelagia TaxID=2819984 RepID=A0ABS3T198_9FLAO|nr:glycosyl hydrolase 53 family protein [Winogradskyella sp. DF17]MBO3115646.1 glycosyl hydrolase 53 family protein [Winogradskyella sp. DF17]